MSNHNFFDDLIIILGLSFLNFHASNRFSCGIGMTNIVANSFGMDNIFTKIH